MPTDMPKPLTVVAAGGSPPNALPHGQARMSMNEKRAAALDAIVQKVAPQIERLVREALEDASAATPHLSLVEPEPLLLSRAQVAKLLGISVGLVKGLTPSHGQGELPTVLIGDRVLVPSEAVHAFIATKIKRAG